MRALKGFISVLALLLVGFVVVGLALPGDWSAARSRVVAAPASQVFPYLEDLTLWRDWSSMGQVQGTLSDPSRGEGATLSWDDPQWGAGTFRLTGVTALEQVRYEVLVEDGDLRTRGVIQLTSRGDSTAITWHEEGDLGWNPLLAWFALGMDRMQGEELQKSLDRLQALLEG